MASSDDEGEPMLHSVADYHFADDTEEPVSFSELPVEWDNGERTGGNKKQIFINGTIDNGLQKIYKQITAWKFDLSNANLEILVLSKENRWMKLQKPRKSHEDVFRTILITLQSLHFLRKYPETSGKGLLDHLSKVFRYESRPTENDLVDHMDLISEAVKRDKLLAKSKFVITFLDEKPRKRKAFDEDVESRTRPGFIVDDDIINEVEEDESDDEEQGDKVCAICDNGGEILTCEGKCLRSFHATEEDGADSACDTLGFSAEEVEAIQNFYCKNCQYRQHQCFACGDLGSSDENSSAIEVFRCASGECGRFYHPHCVSKLLHTGSESEAEVLEKKISEGASFTCPFHKCCICKQTETEKDPDLRFAMCRRCPKSYHRKCLPSEIIFDEEDDDVIVRAWENLMPKKRILIYCLYHDIDYELKTPLRNHIKFPGEAKKKQASELRSSKEKPEFKKRNLVLEDASRKKTSPLKPSVGRDKLSTGIKQISSLKRTEGKITGLDSSKKRKVMDVPRRPLNKTSSMVKSIPDKGKPSLGELLYAFHSKGSDSNNTDAADGEQDQTVKPITKEISSLQPLDAESERRILALMKDATSSVTLAEINEQHKVPTTHAYSSKTAIDKTITLGKVEGYVQAVRAAVQKLEEGCSMEDAKTFCGTGLLSEMIKWKSKLRVYLAPFLHGMRYTSFGRHFTKMDKLKKVVDILHWYAQDGDMIVDFCCGANDFSCLMKKKLDEVGKECSYKNYDVMQPKNDFNFEKRDWMTVTPKELPPGSKLIMGLNPPFGVKSALANKFIDKALEFKPKLIVLIVPQETERLDRKNPPYDLVFEDIELLSGKSFYLPGSVDVNDKQIEQWNVVPPPLSLWSRQDWTTKHKTITEQHNHLYGGQQVSHTVEDHRDVHILALPLEDNKLILETSMLSESHSPLNEEPKQLIDGGTSVKENFKGGLPDDNGHSGPRNHDSGDSGNNPNENSKKRHRNKDAKAKEGKGSGYISPKDKQKYENSLHCKSQSVKTPPLTHGENDGYQHCNGRVCISRQFRGSGEISLKQNRSSLPRQTQAVETSALANTGAESYQHFDGRVSKSRQFRGSGEISPKQNRSSLLHQTQAVETSALANTGEESYQHFDGRIASSRQFLAGYTGSREDDMVRRYGSLERDPFQNSLYRSRFPEEHFADYQRERMDNRALMPWIDNPPIQRSSYLGSHDPRITAPYENFGPGRDLSYGNEMGSSTMQRYAPRLDELNHPRMSNSGSEAPFPTGGGVYDPRAPRPIYRDHPYGYPPGPGPGPYF